MNNTSQSSPIMTMRYAWRVFRRNLTVFNKLYKSNLTINFIEPMLYLFAFGVGLGAYVQDIGGISYIKYIAPGMVCYSALFAAAFECLYDTYTRMVFQKTFDAILATPVNPEGVIFGELLYAGFKAVLFGAIIMTVVYIFQLISTPFLPLCLPFVFMGGITLASMSMTVTSLVRGIESFSYYVSIVITPLMLFSGVFFPLDGILGKLSVISPFYHAAKVCQLLARGEFTGIWIHGLVLLAMMLAAMAVAVHFMKRKLTR